MRLSGWFGLAGFEPGDGLGGGPGDLGEQLVAVIDPERGVGLLDGDRAAGVADPDLDLLPGDADAAAAADPAVGPQRRRGDRRRWSGGAGVAGAGQLCRG
jgi:hypothetical protein